MSAGRAALLAAALGGVLTGCGAEDAPRELTVGSHRVVARVPAGWEVLDQGRQILIRRAPAVLTLQDMGPAGPPGIRREVERAQELWRTGQAGEARWRMQNVRVPLDLLPTPAHVQAFSTAWSKIVRAPNETPFTQVEPAFATILAYIDAMPPRDLPALADTGLAGLGHDQRRDVKARRPTKVDGRDALDVETWNRLTHASLQRLLFIVNDGSLLVLRTEPGAEGEAVAAFERVAGTLQFPAAGTRR